MPKHISFICASNRSRTCTHLREQRPERCASANSAIEATFEHIYHTKKLIKLERKILITEQDNLFFPLSVCSSQQNFLLKIMLFISI